MKNHTLLQTLTLLLLIIVIQSCKKKEQHTDNGKKSTYVTPRKIISVEKGINLFKEYDKNRTQLIEPQLRKLYNDSTFVDTKFVWYSLKEIKEYIKYIDEVQKQNPAYNVTGLRLYYGAYSNNNNNTSKKHINQQTFFMVPTIKSSKKDNKYLSMNHIPFSIKYKNKNNPIKGELVAIKDLMLDYNKEERLKPYFKSKIQQGNFSFNISPFSLRSDETSLVYNEGEMAPPPYPDKMINSN